MRVDPLGPILVDELGVAATDVRTQVGEEFIAAREQHLRHGHDANADGLPAQHAAEDPRPDAQVLSLVVQLMEEIPIFLGAALDVDFRQQRQGVPGRHLPTLHEDVLVVQENHSAIRSIFMMA